MKTLVTVLLLVSVFFLAAFAPSPQIQAQNLQAPPAGAEVIDLAAVGDAAVNGLPLAVVVFALVAFLKSLGVSGKKLTISSFTIGLILGLAYMYSLAPLTTFTQWFGAAVFGLALGAIASGSYDGIRSATSIAKG